MATPGTSVPHAGRTHSVIARGERVGVGIAALVLSVILFPLSDTLAKLLAETHTGPEVAWMRYAVLLAAVLPVLVRRPSTLKTARPVLQIARGLAAAGATGSALIGFAYLPVADATAIAFCAPLIVTALAAIVLKERVGTVRWATTAVGFAGVLVIVQPGGSGFSAASALPLVSSVFSALTVTLTRIGRTERIETTLIITTLVGFAVLSVPVGFAWHAPTPTELLLGLAMGGLAAAASLLQLFAYRCAWASLLAPFSYAQILCAIGLGWLFTGTVPNLTMLVGSAVVIGSGAASGWRPARRQIRRRIDWSAVRRDLARVQPAMWGSV